ncbi:MAG: DUF2877 domain-containing protein [Chloroflexia bacterium]
MNRLFAVSSGAEAAVLGRERGVVLGAGSKAAYLCSESGAVVGLVDSGGFDGPVTVRVRGLGAALGMLGDCAGKGFEGDGGTLKIAGKVEIDLGQAERWVPPDVSFEGDGEKIRKAVRALDGAIQGSGVGGRGSGVVGGHQHPSPDLRPLLLAWQDRDAGRTAGEAVKLLGRGPGLTPSGDDLLAGLLAVLRWGRGRLEGVGGERALAVGDATAEAVLAEAPVRTTWLSARLLAYAAEGILFEPAMRLGVVLGAGRIEEVEGAAGRLFRLGHSSGVEMALGMWLGAGLVDGRYEAGQQGI